MLSDLRFGRFLRKLHRFVPFLGRGCRNERKKKLGVSNTPYDGGRRVTDGGWWVTDGGWWVTDGGWCVTDGGWWVTDGGWCVTDGGWWGATKHQRLDAIVKKKRVSVLMAPPVFGPLLGNIVEPRPRPGTLKRSRGVAVAGEGYWLRQSVGAGTSWRCWRRWS